MGWLELCDGVDAGPARVYGTAEITEALRERPDWCERGRVPVAEDASGRRYLIGPAGDAVHLENRDDPGRLGPAVAPDLASFLALMLGPGAG